MEISQIKKILDRHGSQVVNRFVKTQEILLDSLKAELARSMDRMLPEIIRECQSEVVKKENESKELPNGKTDS